MYVSHCSPPQTSIDLDFSHFFILHELHDGNKSFLVLAPAGPARVGLRGRRLCGGGRDGDPPGVDGAAAQRQDQAQRRPRLHPALLQARVVGQL